jgi:hypothetical protein
VRTNLHHCLLFAPDQIQHFGQREPTEIESRRYFVGAPNLGDGVFEPTGHTDLDAVESLIERIQWIELEGFLDLGGACLGPAEEGEKVRVENACFRVVGVELDRPLERQLRRFPVPLVPRGGAGKHKIRLGEGII